ncbi:TAXI family TRAP transporter solute-binding subunit [Amycolatopsis nigrescens]|uniref:TAXI family TRAP transporter solute-binding subunit n=1 Tax=Amycolatopsis nigrescens TaxID=381445 RepID=UPI0004782367|nr:TAXI family TRAP transporter solute-binding subunit [Amycolatopsis nigrescens]
MSVTRRAVLLGGLAAALAGCSPAGYSGPERELVIAGGETGGFYLAFAELLAKELNLAEPRLRCTAVPTQASVANVQRVRDGTADLALVLADAAQAAVNAEPPFPAPVQLRALGRVYENYLQLVVRADSGIRALADLAGRRVSLGATGSGAALSGERLVAKAGLAVEVEHLPLAAAIAGLRERRVSALLWSGGVPTPALAELDREVPIALLPLDGVLPGLRSAYGPVYELARVPAGGYRMVGELPTIGVANLLVGSAELAEDVAAAVVRVLVNRAGDLVPAEAVGAQFLDVRTLIGTGTVPLHPGAASTYRRLHG